MRQNVQIMVLGLLCPALICAVARAEDNAELAAAWNAVAAKYPSEQELRQLVDSYKSEHATEFAAAKADFELAVRSMVGLEFPPSPRQLSHVKFDNPMPALYRRDALTESVTRLRSQDTPEAQRYADFYEAHFEEIALEQTPAHRYVYLDCLLNGWSDWTHWTTPKLIEVREKYPDIYLIYVTRETFSSIRTLEGYDLLKNVIPLLFRLLEDQSATSIRREWTETLLGSFCSAEKDFDVMKYCMLEHVATGDKRYLSFAGSASSRLVPEQRRIFWQPYLENHNEEIRVRAVEHIGDTIRKPRPGEDPRPEDAALAEQLRQILQNDPSPRVKDKARYKLRLYDKSDTRPTHGRLGVPNSP